MNVHQPEMNWKEAARAATDKKEALERFGRVRLCRCPYTRQSARGD